METSYSLLKMALSLKPQDRFILIDQLIQSLDKPDREINDIWIDEASKRLEFHRKGKTQGLSSQEVFGEI